eukprot:scaffold2134_cov110-Isochrysis_galbana.AAC.3
MRPTLRAILAARAVAPMGTKLVDRSRLCCHTLARLGRARRGPTPLPAHGFSSCRRYGRLSPSVPAPGSAEKASWSAWSASFACSTIRAPSSHSTSSPSPTTTSTRSTSSRLCTATSASLRARCERKDATSPLRQRPNPATHHSKPAAAHPSKPAVHLMHAKAGASGMCAKAASLVATKS